MKGQLLILLAIGVLLTCNLYGQVSVPNGNFELSDKSSPTKTVNWKAESNDFVCVVDNNTSYKGTYSMKISSKAAGNHFFNEEFPFTSKGLKKYKYKCAFKTRKLHGAIQLGVRVFVNDGNTLALTAFTLTENKNQEWTTNEGMFITDKAANKIRLFGNLAGTGDAWFDEMIIEEIPAPQKAPSTEVALYIHEYFDIVYENSIITDKNFISNLKSETMYLCSDSVEKKECYKVLKEYTTKKLNDHHSFFTTPEEWKAMMEKGKHPRIGKTFQELPSGKIMKENIGYISIPMFISNDQKLIAQYADTLQKIIAKFDKREVNGYIIDLSSNGGGNSMPMIAGVGPLIGNGVCGYSFSGDGSIRKRIYNDGWTGWDTSLVFQKVNPYHLLNPNKPIAIIYSNETGSSGEVVALAFVGLPNVKSFGQQTAGITTRVDNFEMSDGAFLNLVSGVDADRNKNKFGGTIKPDFETKDTESAIQEATKWILRK